VPVQRCTLPIPLIPLWTVRPVQSLSVCTRVHLTLPTPLIPLWTFRPVQSLSACTTVHFNFTCTSTSQGPYSLYRASVTAQRCTLPLPIPLFSLWAIQPVQSLSACTTVHFNFTYKSNPPRGRIACTVPRCLTTVHFNFTYISTTSMGRTACTEPQCQYNGALYLYLYLYNL